MGAGSTIAIPRDFCHASACQNTPGTSPARRLNLSPRPQDSHLRIPRDPVTLSTANKPGEPSRGLFPPTSVLHPVTHIPSAPSPAPPGFVLLLLPAAKRKVTRGEELLTQPQQTTATEQCPPRHEIREGSPIASASRL